MSGTYLRVASNANSGVQHDICLMKAAWSKAIIVSTIELKSICLFRTWYNVTPANNIFTWGHVTSDDEKKEEKYYEIVVPEGNYSADDLAKAIVSAMNGVMATFTRQVEDHFITTEYEFTYYINAATSKIKFTALSGHHWFIQLTEVAGYRATTMIDMLGLNTNNARVNSVATADMAPKYYIQNPRSMDMLKVKEILVLCNQVDNLKLSHMERYGDTTDNILATIHLDGIDYDNVITIANACTFPQPVIGDKKLKMIEIQLVDQDRNPLIFPDKYYWSMEFDLVR